MLIISSSIVLDSYAISSGNNPDNPIIGYDNIVSVLNVSATTEDPNFPASNLANPATHLHWLATSLADQYLTVVTDGFTPVEYIALAGHNLGSTGAIVSVEKFLSGSWIEIETEVMLSQDDPVFWRVDPFVGNFRVRIQPGSEEPMVAVLYAGELLVMERRIYAGHAPILYARRLSVSNNRSERGEFLGRVVTGEWRETVVSFTLITPEWFRENMPDFLDAARDRPFFFVWRPNTYIYEVGYVWLIDDPTPINQDASSNFLMAFDLKMAGVA